MDLVISFADSATALRWLASSPFLIAVGTASGWVRVHDCRTGNSAEMNIVAHTEPKSKRVKGIRLDPFNSHVLATFSDSPHEPVKVAAQSMK